MEHTTSEIPSPGRAMAYRRRMEQRRQYLCEQLSAILRPNTAFVWEVGCGHGHFLTAYAQAHPETVCVGIDIMGDRIDRALRKRHRARLSNLHFLHADARLFLEAIPPGVALTRVFILFPDPWPKLRHHKHRILRADFLTQTARHANIETRLYFRTDFTPYFRDAQSIVTSHESWETTADPWPFEFSTVFQERAAHHDSLVARLRPETLPTIS